MKKIFNWDNLIALLVIIIYLSTTLNIIIGARYWEEVVSYTILIIFIVCIFYLLKRFRFKNYPKLAKWLLFFFCISILLYPYCQMGHKPHSTYIWTYNVQNAKEIQQYADTIDKIVNINIEFHDKNNIILPPLPNEYINDNFNKYYEKVKNEEVEYQIRAYSNKVIAHVAQKYANDKSVYIQLPNGYLNTNLKKEKQNIESQYAFTIADMDGVKRVDVNLNNYNRIFKNSTIIVDIYYVKNANTKSIQAGVEKLLNTRDWKTQINLKPAETK